MARKLVVRPRATACSHWPPPAGQDWLVIEDQEGQIAWRYGDQAEAEHQAQQRSRRAEELGIVTRYRAVPESMLTMVHQLLLYHRNGVDIDWRPEVSIPEDYYLQL